MTFVVLQSIICQWLNGLGYRAIQTPSDNPAPQGKYVAVAVSNSRQQGDVLVPGPKKNNLDKKYKAVMQVANVQLYEVEGDGELLRDVRNRMACGELDDFVATKCPPMADGSDTGFSVWEIADIVDNSSQDGAYWIRQKTMSFDCQFYDFIEHNTPRMMKVSGVLGTDENFKSEVN